MCGRPRGLAQKRPSWGLQCRTAIIPHAPDPAEHGDQITNDLICNAGVWRNGGEDHDTHVCDECIRVGLRVIKLKVDEMLGAIEADTDKDAELAALTQRLGLVQHYHQSLAYAHDRMQIRLGKMMKILDAHGVEETDEIRHARWEAKRGPAIRGEEEYVFAVRGEDSALVARCAQAITALDRVTPRPLTAEDQARAVLSALTTA
jgi:hypothetical protein